jgi:flagellar assembly factor FliW
MTAAAPLLSRAIELTSDLLGPLAVDEDELFVFTDGMLGFPACRRWVLVHAPMDGCAWLQSVDEPAVAFLLVDPFRACPGYAVDLSPADLLRVDGSNHADLVVMCVATLPRSEEESASVNLQGPVVLNIKERRGAQIVVSDSQWGLRHLLDLAEFS